MPEELAESMRRIQKPSGQRDGLAENEFRDKIVGYLVDEFWTHDCHFQYLRAIADSLAYLEAYGELTELLAVISDNEGSWIHLFQEDVQNGASIKTSLRARKAVGNLAMVCEGACEVVRNIGKQRNLEDMKRIIPYLGYDKLGLSVFRAVRRFILCSESAQSLREISSALDNVDHPGMNDGDFRSNVLSHSYLLRRYIRAREDALREGIKEYP